MKITRKPRPDVPQPQRPRGPWVLFAGADEPKLIVVGRDELGRPIYAPIRERSEP